MNKAVLISIRPKWCELIAVGRKTLELRKTVPNTSLPFKCYIYQTKRNWIYKILKRFSSFGWAQCVVNGQTKVIGEFTCDYIMRFCHMANADMAERASCVRREDIFEYSCGNEVVGWQISDLKIYDKPKDLCEFYKVGTLSASDWEYQLYDGSGDPSRRSYASYLFTRAIRKPPQSWCYVEEMQDGK